MPRTRQALAQSIAQQVAQVENAVDHLIIAGCSLATRLVEARLQGGYAAQVGQEQFAKVAALLSAATQIRGNAVDAHVGLSELADTLGLAVVSEGDKTSIPMVRPATTELRSVA